MVSSDAIPALKPVTLPKDFNYDEGVITWNTQAGDIDGGKSSIKAEEIFLVAQVPDGTYLILTLTETQGQQGQQDTEGGKKEEEEEGPFRLSSFLTPHLPSELLDQHLLGSLPDFLQTGSDSSLDIIVSVRSGTGLSQNFYDAVLQPLLSILGLKNGSITTTATAPTTVTSSSSSSSSSNVAEEVNSYQVLVTRDANTVRNFARERWGTGGDDGETTGEKKKKKETVLLLSGDGGVVDLLSGSSATPSSSSAHHLPTIVLLPLGTGNALFHSLHKPHYNNNNNKTDKTTLVPSSPLVLALRTLLKGKPAPLPTFQAIFTPEARLIAAGEGGELDNVDNNNNDDDGVTTTTVGEMTGGIVASYGFHSQLVWESDTPAYRVHGAKRFGMVAQELLKESHAYHAVVETGGDGNERRVVAGVTTTTSTDTGASSSPLPNKFNYILTTLCSNLEKTFTISPESRPLDGVLRLVHFGGMDGKQTMDIMMAAYNEGSHVGMPGVGYEVVGEEIKVTTLEEDARWRKVCIDGTIVELPKDGSMTIRRSPAARLQVVVLEF